MVMTGDKNKDETQSPAVEGYRVSACLLCGTKQFFFNVII